MAKGYHSALLGWTLALGVSFTAILGLPKLAGASSSLKDQARWQSRAHDFQQADMAAYTGASLYEGSALVGMLAENQLDTNITNKWMLDLRTNTEATPSAHTMIAGAKSMRREVNCLAEAVYYEARSERLAGQKAVAEVVLNRVKSKHFPNTVCGVVYQGAERTTGCQFSFTCDGSTAKLPYGVHWERSQTVSEHMIMGASAPLTRRSTHYHTTDVSPKWAPLLRQTRQFDTHVFYRFMPRKKQFRTVSAAP